MSNDSVMGSAALSSTPLKYSRGDLPWAVQVHRESAFIIGAGDETIAARLSPELAALIVKSVNAFEPMREALQKVAAQKIGDEIGDEEARDDADYQFAFEQVVLLAREAALKLAGDAT